MIDTIILENEQATQKYIMGVCKVANPVESTMGPKGKNVMIHRSGQAPIATNDGKSVGDYITSSDKFIEMGVESSKEVGRKTDSAIGDFTSTSISLHKAMVIEGTKKTLIGYDGNLIKQGMKKAVEDITEELKALSKPITTFDEIKNVATISSESAEYGMIIAETIEKVGKDGVVTVEESNTFGIESEIVEGMEIDKGYFAPYMINNVARREASLKNIPVFVYDGDVSYEEALALILYFRASKVKEAVLVVDGFSQDANILAFENKLKDIFNLYVIKSPGYGEGKKELLEDIAVVCGTKVFNKTMGGVFPEVTPTGVRADPTFSGYIGSIDRIVIGKDKTTLVSSNATNKEAIDAQIERLREQAKHIEAEFELERVEKRIARLAGGVAVIRVGAATDGEARQLKDKIDDAVASTKCAIAEGVVAGGGVALLKASINTKKHDYTKETEEFKMGYEIILKAVEAPLRAIARNAKKDEGVVLDKILNGKDMYGFNALTMEYGDMIAMGVIESVKGNRVALYNAYSEASTMLTGGNYIAQEEIKERSDYQQ